MSKIKELLDKYRSITDHYADQQWYDEDVEKAMREYADFAISEFRKSSEYMELLEESEWLMCLEQAGVDNWSGYDYAKELLNKA